MLSCEYCKIFKNTVFYITTRVAAPASSESFQTAVSSGKEKDTFGKIKLLTVQLRKKTYCGYYHFSVNHLQPFLFTLFTLVFFHILVLVDQ